MQQSIGQIGKPQEILERADKLRSLLCAGGSLEVRPIGRDQRFAAVRQDDQEVYAGGHAGLTKDCQRLSFEWVMRTCDGHALGEVLRMGSVSWCPLGPWTMRSF